MSENLGTCPVIHGSHTEVGSTNNHWWPKALNLDILHQHDTKTNPLGKNFNYREELKKLDFDALKKDLHELITNSKSSSQADWA